MDLPLTQAVVTLPKRYQTVAVSRVIYFSGHCVVDFISDSVPISHVRHFSGRNVT